MMLKFVLYQINSSLQFLKDTFNGILDKIDKVNEVNNHKYLVLSKTINAILTFFFHKPSFGNRFSLMGNMTDNRTSLTP